MLTLFSVPRAFSGHTGVIQHNAIESWVRLDADCEVILFGDDAGVAEASRRHGVKHEPQVMRTPQGTPILRDVFDRADAIARHSTLCFVNADIVLFVEILAAMRRVAATHRRFLIVASRFNSQIEEPLVFDDGWDRALRVTARNEGRMYPAAGSDIFIYPRGLFGTVPPFAIGRNFWDNWLMHRALENGARLIDATEIITAVHQDHDYSHVPDMPTDAKKGPVVINGEGQQNLALAGGVGRLTTVYDATEILTADGRLVSTLRPRLVRRRIKAWLRRAAGILAPRLWTMLSRLRHAVSQQRGS